MPSWHSHQEKRRTMTLNLVKLCVGAASIEELASWQAERLTELREAGKPEQLSHRTFQTPKREAELLDGGSLYWVIKGVIQARQRLVGFTEGTKDDGSRCCLILINPEIVAVRPQPRRPFQGWRYLEAADAPPDLGRMGKGVSDMPPKLRRELAELGLL
jgi:hypothetical protein